MKNETQPPIWQEVPSALLVPAACVGFTRVFIENSAIYPIIAAALLSSAIAILARRLQVPLLFATIGSLVALVLLITNRYAPGTARFYVIPTGASYDALNAQFDDLVGNFRSLESPVEALDPFIGAAMVGAWIMAFLTDWGAMRLRLAFEPILPGTLLFIFSSIAPINSGKNLVVSTIVFGLSIALWSVSQRSASLLQRGVWLPNDGKRGPASVARLGGAVALAAVVIGSLVGPRLPGAEEASAWIELDGNANKTRVVVSPHVKLKARLVEQTDLELFQVSADRPSFWRIAGLDTYEKDTWRVSGQFKNEDGRLPGVQLGGPRIDITQSYSIKALSAIWLPAAFPPVEIQDANIDVTWNTENGSLAVRNDVENSDGVSYTVLSSVPSFSAQELRQASDFVPDDIKERYLPLPDLPNEVADLARQITENEATTFDKMLALQNHFRGYDYSIDLSPREGDPILQFLNERVGFCQQFSGTFALMARSLGIPARVATGFTWGDEIGQTETGQTIYSVTGRHTHAWPEVYFDGLGWVPFEPTPGRGLPDAFDYTGIPGQQDGGTSPGVPAELPEANTQAPTVETIPSTPPTSAPPAEAEAEATAAGAAEPSENPIVRFFGWLFSKWEWILGLAAIVAYLIGLPLYHKLRRKRRRESARSNAEQVETAWAEAVEVLEFGFDIQRSESETRTEFAHRLADDQRVPDNALDELANSTTIARFHPVGVTSEQASSALHQADRVNQQVIERLPTSVRYRKLLDPRNLLKPTNRTVLQPEGAKAQVIDVTIEQSDEAELINS